MYKNILIIYCIILFSCQENEKQAEIPKEASGLASFQGKIMEVPDSIIQKYKDRKEGIFIKEINGYKYPIFYKNCLNRGYLFSDYLASPKGEAILSSACINIEIDNGIIQRIEEKPQFPIIIPKQDSFTLSYTMLTPKAKIFLQKQRHLAVEPPAPKIQILVNGKENNGNKIKETDSLVLYIKPDSTFKRHYYYDAQYYLKEMSIYIKNKEELEKRIEGASLLGLNDYNQPRGLKIALSSSSWDKKDAKNTSPNPIWDKKNTEYILVKIKGLYRKKTLLAGTANKSDSLLPIYQYDSLFKFYPIIK